MKILGMSVNWNLDWANDPILEVLIDEIPSNEVLRYEEKDNMFFAEHDGFVRFFYRSKDTSGFGGSTFNLTMKDGSKVALKGPWSSRSGCTNKLGFECCTEVRLTTDFDDFLHGRFYQSGHITVRKLNDALPTFLPGLHLRRVIEHDEPCYVICPIGAPIEQAKMIGSGLYPPRSKGLPKNVVHISNPLQKFKDELANQIFGSTKGEAHETQICINCKLPVINRIETDKGWREYAISGLCEPCFQEITKEGDE